MRSPIRFSSASMPCRTSRFLTPNAVADLLGDKPWDTNRLDSELALRPFEESPRLFDERLGFHLACPCFDIVDGLMSLDADSIEVGDELPLIFRGDLAKEGEGVLV